MADSTVDDGSTGTFSLVPVDHDPFAVGSIPNPQTSMSGSGFGAPNNMPGSTAIDDGSTPPPTPSPASGGGSGWWLVPVDNDPFTSPSFSLVPVDHDPFAAGSTANPPVGASDNGFGAPNSQYQLSPLGSPGQVVPRYDVLQALKLGQPIAPRPMGASSSGNQVGSLSPDGPIAKPGQTIPPDNPIGAYNAARLQISHALFPGLTDYLTQTPPVPSLVANAQGKLPPTDNPYAVPALLDAATIVGPELKLGALAKPFAAMATIGGKGLPMDTASRLARATSMGFLPDMPIKFDTAPSGEKIAAAALKLNDRIFTGADHAEALAKAEGELGIPFDQMQQAPIMDGFTTTAGRFVSRREAAEIAQREGQGETQGTFGATRGLASEDMSPAPAPAASRSRTGATARGLMGGEGVWGVVQQPGRPASGVLWHRSDRPASFDAAGLEDYEIQESLRNAWDNGYDSVLMKNYIRPGGAKPESIMVVRNLNQLRSPRTAFDPVKKLSPNILAGFGAVAAIPASQILMPLENDQDQQ